MKKFFKSAFSLFTSLALVTGTGAVSVYAEELTTETGVLELEDNFITLNQAQSDTMLSLPDSPSILANYSSDAYNYGYFLDENNVEVYKAFMTLINPSTDRIVVELPNPVTFTSSSSNIDMSNEDLFNAVFYNCKPGMDAAELDMPELFWLSNGETGVGVESMPYTYSRTKKLYTFTLKSLVFVPAYQSSYSDIDEVIEYKQKLNDAVENFEVEGSTRYEQLKSIHDQISLRTYYDVDAKFSSSAVGSLVEPGVVCEGYSKGFKLICDKVGIPCVVVFGNYDKEASTAHMWNYVKMEDGKWYAVDVTWDDTDGSDNKGIIYTYFLKGSVSFNENHEPSEDMIITTLTYPELSETDYDPNNAQPVTETTASTTTTESTSTSTTASTTTSITSSTTTSSSTSTTSVTASSSETESAETSTTTTSASTKASTSSETTVTSSTTASTTTRGKKTTTSTTTSTASSSTSTATASTTTTTTTAEPVFDAGDVNHDGKVDVADLVYLARTLAGQITPEFSCDVNADGNTDVFDLISLRKILTK